MTSSRQSHLDALRGIAALIVVISHYLAAFYPYTIFGTQGGYPQHNGWENLVFFPPFGLFVSGHFAVCLFFILSGYVLSYSHLGVPQRRLKIIGAIIKRPIRLGGLVWFTISCGALLWYFDLFANGAVADLTGSRPWFNQYWLGDFVANTFFMDFFTSSFSKGTTYNPPLWTIKIELYGSLMVYLFALFLGQSKHRILISILLIIAFKNSLYQGFWIGLFLADIIKNKNLLNSKKITATHQYLLLTTFIYLSSYPNYATQEFLEGTIYNYLPDDRGFGGGYAMLSAVIIFILVTSSSTLKRHLNLPALQFLGHISYGLYVVHFLIIGSFSSWLFLTANNYFDYNLSFLFTLISGLPLIIAAAYLVTKYVDNPAIIFANYLGDKIMSTTSYQPVKQLILRLRPTNKHSPSE